MGCTPHENRDIPEPGHLSPAVAKAPSQKRGQVHEDKHYIVGKNNNPMSSRNSHHRKRWETGRGRKLQQKVARAITPPAYLSRAAMPDSVHHNNSSCIYLGERARDLD